MWDIAKAILSFCSFHLKKSEKEEQVNHRVRRRKDIIKMTAEILTKSKTEKKQRSVK